MRAIAKGPEPPSLTAHRKTSHSDYENYDHKDALRHALITEQGGICCYCMGRIRNDPTTTKIEHWNCQRYHRAEQLLYQNLLGACLGGQGQPPQKQHCDTRKRDQDLIWNPANPNHHIETRIEYGADGSIRSNDVGFNTQLNDLLNLNLPFLKNNRKELFDGILEWWRYEKAHLRGPVPRSRIERERDRWLGSTGELQPYCQVAVWLLEQRLAKMQP